MLVLVKLKTKYLIFPLIVSETVLLDEERRLSQDNLGLGGLEACCMLQSVINPGTFI